MQTPNLTQSPAPCAHTFAHDRQGALHILECVRCGHKAVIPDETAIASYKASIALSQASYGAG